MKQYVYTEKGAAIMAKRFPGTKAGDTYDRPVSKAILKQYVKAGFIAEKKYKVIMRGGSVKHDLCTGISYEEALYICEDYGWQFDPDGGYIWDLEIEEV